MLMANATKKTDMSTMGTDAAPPSKRAAESKAPAKAEATTTEPQSRDAAATKQKEAGADAARISNDSGIGPDDVLLGRGGATNGHTGNRKFRTIVATHQQEYLKARKREKVGIARRIVAIVKGNGGRFLKRTENAQNWVEVTDKRAQEKTSQALREGLDVRNNTIRPSKMIKEVRPAVVQQQQRQQPADMRGNNAVKITIPQFSPNSTVSANLHEPAHQQYFVPRLSVPTLTVDGTTPVHPVYLHYQISPVIIKQKDVKDAYEV